MAFEHVALVDFGFALNGIFQVCRLFFLRHPPNNSIQTGFFLSKRSVLNRLSNIKLKMHYGFSAVVARSRMRSSIGTCRILPQSASCCGIFLGGWSECF